MRKVTLLICVMAMGVAGFGRVDAAKKKAKDKTQLLSAHETEAVFTGIEFRTCRGKTGRCPQWS